MLRGAKKDVRPLMLELVEGLDDGDLATTQLVVFERVHEAPIEGRLQFGGEAVVVLVADDRRGGRDDEV